MRISYRGLTHTDVYSGDYRGIGFKITRTSRGENCDKDAWSYSVFLRRENFAFNGEWEESTETTTVNDRTYYSAEAFSNCGSLSSGKPWATATCNPNRPNDITLEVGWGRPIGWAIHRDTEIASAVVAAEITIGKIHDKFHIRLHCFVDGTWQSEEDLEAYTNAKLAERPEVTA